MKFNIEKVRRLMEETQKMDIVECARYIRDTAPDIHATPIADAIITGIYDPVAWAQEYNETAGEKAMEYASGKVKL
jgi:hypothetical protein